MSCLPLLFDLCYFRRPCGKPLNGPERNGAPTKAWDWYHQEASFCMALLVVPRQLWREPQQEHLASHFFPYPRPKYTRPHTLVKPKRSFDELSRWLDLRPPAFCFSMRSTPSLVAVTPQVDTAWIDRVVEVVPPRPGSCLPF